MIWISVFLFVGYIAYCVWRFGWPSSISDTFYLFEQRQRGAGWIFTVWCFVMSILFMAQMLDALNGSAFQFVGFLAGVGLAFVGAAPHFRGYERAIHYAGAGVSALFGAIWCVLTGFWPLMVLLVGLAVLVSNLRVPAWKWDGREHTLFCYEMAMFVSVLVGLLAV